MQQAMQHMLAMPPQQSEFKGLMTAMVRAGACRRDGGLARCSRRGSGQPAQGHGLLRQQASYLRLQLWISCFFRHQRMHQLQHVSVFKCLF